MTSLTRAHRRRHIERSLRLRCAVVGVVASAAPVSEEVAGVVASAEPVSEEVAGVVASEGLEAGVLGAKAGWGEGLVVEVKVVGWEGVARARRR